MDGRGYGVKYEHVAIPPSILLSFAPWRGGRQHAELMQALPYTGGLGVLLRDHGEGEVRTGRDGEPVVRYKLSTDDVEHLRRGMRGAAQRRRGDGRPAGVLVALQVGRLRAGPRAATSTASCATPTPAGGAPGRRRSSSFHIMGSARMGRSPAGSVCDPDRSGLGHARPVRVRRLGVPDRVGREPDGHDRVARAHERARPRRPAGVGLAGRRRRRLRPERPGGRDRAGAGRPARNRARGPGDARRRLPLGRADAAGVRARHLLDRPLARARLAVPAHAAAGRARLRARPPRRRRSPIRSTTGPR